MSSIVIAGDTSGSVTLQAPAVSGSTVLNLPATSGTIQASGAGYTTNGVAYATSATGLVTGSALTFDGTDLTFQSAIKLLNSDGGGNKAILSTHLYGGSGATGTLTLSSTYGNSNQTRIKVGVGGAAATSFENDSTEIMRLTTTGLGIGISSPVSKIHAYGTGQIGTIESSGDYSSSGSGFIRYKDSTGNRGYVGFGGTSNLMTISNAIASGNLNFEVGGGERMRVTYDGNFLFNSGYGSVAIAYGTRSWVNFNGTGTVAIRSSGNVSSITDNGVGDYTVNFTNSMPDTNYAFFAGAQANGVANGPMLDLFAVGATASARFRVFSQAAAVMDSPVCTFMAVR
jgi:hypothetical protein